MMIGLLPLLRRHARLLAALAALAFLLPGLAPRNAAAAPALTLVICTSEGFVSLPLEGDGGGEGGKALHADCAACLRQHLAALLPPGPPRVAAPSIVARAEALPPPPARHHAAPHQRPQARAPPALS